MRFIFFLLFTLAFSGLATATVSNLALLYEFDTACEGCITAACTEDNCQGPCGYVTGPGGRIVTEQECVSADVHDPCECDTIKRWERTEETRIGELTFKAEGTCRRHSDIYCWEEKSAWYLLNQAVVVDVNGQGHSITVIASDESVCTIIADQETVQVLKGTTTTVNGFDIGVVENNMDGCRLVVSEIGGCPNPDVVPEFSTIAALLALAGASIGYLVIRNR
jgi:hypothetical protein